MLAEKLVLLQHEELVESVEERRVAKKSKQELNVYYYFHREGGCKPLNLNLSPDYIMSWPIKKDKIKLRSELKCLGDGQLFQN